MHSLKEWKYHLQVKIRNNRMSVQHQRPPLEQMKKRTLYRPELQKYFFLGDKYSLRTHQAPPLLAILFPLDGLGGVSHKSLENRLMSGTTTCLIFNQKMYSLLHSLLFVD